MKVGIRRGMTGAFVATILVGLTLPAAAQIQVSSAVPNTAPQGSTNLIVKIGGKGFKRGAAATFLVTGTTNPGGVTVNSTAFVNASEVDADITVAADATVSGFDIYVSSGGRTGKGTDLFSVTSNPNASQGCVTTGPATGWTLVDVLNHANSSGTPQYAAGALGVDVKVQLVSAPDSTGTVVPQFYVGLAGSGSGLQTIAFILNLDGTVRRSWVVLNNYGSSDIEVGDVNGDGVPDFVMGSEGVSAAHLFIGQLTASLGKWDYSIDPATDVTLISAPKGAPEYFGARVALGDLDGDGADEIAISATSAPHKKVPGTVYIYKYGNGALSLIDQISDPNGSSNDGFGSALAIGDLTDDANTSVPFPDLTVAANNEGIVYVFQNPLGTGSLPVLSYPVPSNNGYASHAAVADVTGGGVPDLVVAAGNKGPEQVDVFQGPLSAGESPTYVMLPQAGLAEGWGTGFSVADIDGDGRADVLVGAPNANYSTACNSSASAGAAYVFRTGSSLFPSYSDLFEVPTVESTFMGFGFSMAAAPYTAATGQPIVLIGENGAMVGTQDGAGQVYIYRKTQ